MKHLAIAALIIAVHVLLSNLFFYSYFATTGMCPLSKIPTTPNAWNVIMVPFLKMVAGELPTEMIARFIEYALIAGALISIDINQENHRKSLELANVQKELNLTYLRALRMQLRPHFLFNTLNSVSSLMHDNVEEAQNVLARLGGLLRKTLQNTDELKLVLRDELNYIRDYLEIEQIRFNDRLMIEYDIDKAALSGLVPSLIMQPIVENAVKHGFKGALEDCTIRIEAKREGSNIRLSVIDNGRGTNNVSKVLKSPGVGIQNTLNRLETLYPERHSVAVHSNANEGLAFHITIPFETLNSDITYAH
ncbi:MAG: histidine kinase [Bacteroidia bacterium]|nr:histidine kinase [Bacteroidia bacterium]